MPYTKEDQKAYDAARSVKRAEMRNERKRRGVCATCGDGVPVNGRVDCQLCLEKGVRANLTWKSKHPQRLAVLRKARGTRIKKAVCDAYGGCCSCCGESEIEFLSIDHINNDGYYERNVLGFTAGEKFYLWLKKQGYPKDRYQLLCMNCNWGKRLTGVCPHLKQH